MLHWSRHIIIILEYLWSRGLLFSSSNAPHHWGHVCWHNLPFSHSPSPVVLYLHLLCWQELVNTVVTDSTKQRNLKALDWQGADRYAGNDTNCSALTTFNQTVGSSGQWWFDLKAHLCLCSYCVPSQHVYPIILLQTQISAKCCMHQRWVHALTSDNTAQLYTVSVPACAGTQLHEINIITEKPTLCGHTIHSFQPMTSSETDHICTFHH